MAEDDRILRFENGSVGSNYAQIPRPLLRLLTLRELAVGGRHVKLKPSDLALLACFADRILGHSETREIGAFKGSLTDLANWSGLSRAGVRRSIARLLEAGIIFCLSPGEAVNKKSVWALSKAILTTKTADNTVLNLSTGVLQMSTAAEQNEHSPVFNLSTGEGSRPALPGAALPITLKPTDAGYSAPTDLSGNTPERAGFSVAPRTPSQEPLLKRGARPQEPQSPGREAEPEPGAPALPDFRMGNGKPEPTLEDLEDAVRRLLGTDRRITDETLQRMLPSFGPLKREIPRIAHEVRRCI